MTAKKTPSPYNIKHRAGRNINEAEKAVLRLVEDKLDKAGYVVLGCTTARVPGLLKFFTTTYKKFGHEPETSPVPPFGVTVVNFLNNGDVTVKILGCEPDGTPVVNETKTQDFKWN